MYTLNTNNRHRWKFSSGCSVPLVDTRGPNTGHSYESTSSLGMPLNLGEPPYAAEAVTHADRQPRKTKIVHNKIIFCILSTS
jgi:hypothetical protein